MPTIDSDGCRPPIPGHADHRFRCSGKTGHHVAGTSGQHGPDYALNLAAGLDGRSQRVLVIDLDPQGGCAVSLGIPTDTLSKAVYNVLMDDILGFSGIVMKTGHGFDLAPSNIDLAGAEVELKQLLAAEQVLRRNLEEIVDDYDFVLFGCPPSLGMLTINALTAASS